ncbi:MAG TPA: sodium:alanine symporter family protein [Longimicrobiales bacterium]
MDSLLQILGVLNDSIQEIATTLSELIWEAGISIGGDRIPFVVIALLGTGVFLTLRLGLVQLRRLGHGIAVTSGKYDDPEEPGDVSHFQALTTALSATVGIGNIAGVAIAIHWGGPGALFWMWVTAFLGMAVKFTEVTLAQHYRQVEAPDRDPNRWEGSVSGGPMYYIERGLGPKWKWMAVFFALMLGTTAFITGNAIQANTVADQVQTTFGWSPWLTGLITTSLVFAVIIGGIGRIGRVTAVLAPAMAAIYIVGALYVILVHYDQILPSFALIFSEAFSPSAGVAGTGVGAVLVTMMWGVKRGLFSNESGQGSAPIAHAAAKTDEPVSEGVVALLEPFIDTIVICSMTALTIIITGVWDDRHPTEFELTSGDISYVTLTESGRYLPTDAPAEIVIEDGVQTDTGIGAPLFAWHEVQVERFFIDPEMTQPFTGTVDVAAGVAVDAAGVRHESLYGEAVETGAPLTALAFEQGLPGQWGDYIVLISVVLFAVSTAISWSYYGDRCANYLFGARAILPYKLIYVAMHFIGAVLPLAAVWSLGDVFLGIVILPNLLALILLSPVVARLTRSYFERKPWIENAEAHKRAVAARKLQPR